MSVPGRSEPPPRAPARVADVDPGRRRGDAAESVTVRVPTFAAPVVLYWVLRGLRERRTAGLPIPAWGVDMARDLSAAAGVEPPSAARGTAPGTLEAVNQYVTTTAAATAAGVSAGYVRRLARTGRVRARQVGRDWLVDPASLTNVLRRTA